MMTRIEVFIKDTAPGGLYGEWAKREECWIKIRESNMEFDLESIKPDLIDKKNPPKRVVISDDEVENQKRVEDYELIKSVPSKIWKRIEEWGRDTGYLSTVQKNVAWNLMVKVRNNSNLIPGRFHLVTQFWT
jgi:hypothetical protein